MIEFDCRGCWTLCGRPFVWCFTFNWLFDLVAAVQFSIIRFDIDPFIHFSFSTPPNCPPPHNNRQKSMYKKILFPSDQVQN